MHDVSMIGLGPMGIALSRALLDGRHRVAVWNRTVAKAAPLVAQGAAAATSAAQAVCSSPIVIVCVADYASSYAVLEAPPLDGKTLIQLSTGTPQDARDMQAWARQRGADHLDGAILATPSQIGRPDTPLFLSGSRAAFERGEPLLRAIAGDLRYLGEAPGAAAAWDLATLCCVFGALFGFVHGARICETEALRVDAFSSMVADIVPMIGEMVRDEGHNIQAQRYEDPESSMKTCAGAGSLFVRQAREAGIDAAFPNFVAGLFERCLAAGYGEQRFASLIKLLRGDVQ